MPAGWVSNTNAGQNYQCGPDSLWHHDPRLAANIIIKDLAEHKNGQNFTYTGNLMNYVWGAGQSGRRSITIRKVTVPARKLANALTTSPFRQ